MRCLVAAGVSLPKAEEWRIIAAFKPITAPSHRPQQLAQIVLIVQH